LTSSVGDSPRMIAPDAKKRPCHFLLASSCDSPIFANSPRLPWTSVPNTLRHTPQPRHHAKSPLCRELLQI
jgi:hypothetical protein